MCIRDSIGCIENVCALDIFRNGLSGHGERRAIDQTGTQKFRLHFDSDDGTYNGVEVCAMQSATIYPASIEIDGSKIKVADRAYDGTTVVADSQIDLSGLVMRIKNGEKVSAIPAGEGITLSYTATYDRCV